MRENINLIEKTTTELWTELQQLRTELETHNHLTSGSQVLNGVVSGILQSPNFITGVSGWQLKPDGSVEFGSGYFRGTLVAASGTLGAITIGTNAWHIDNSGNMWWGNFASYAAATYKISTTGVANLSGLVVGTNVGLGTAQDSNGVTTIIGNTVTTGYVNALSVVAGSVFAENITGTTITGKTFQTAADGYRVKIQGASDQIQFLYNNSIYGLIETFTDASSQGIEMWTGDNLTTDGAGVHIQTGTYVYSAYFEVNGKTLGIFNGEAYTDCPFSCAKMRLPVGTNLY